MAESLQVARGVVDVWPAPGGGGDDDRLTQALLGCPATVLERREGWARVRLSDYEGFVDGAALAPAAVATAGDVLTVTARGVPLHPTATDSLPFDEAYLGTELPVAGPASGARLPLALPGGRLAWIATAAGERRRSGPPPRRSAATAVLVARQFLGCPYLWGGGTYRGIDCSALTQRAYALAGYALPRDADQQWAALPTVVAREALREGDLLFFARDGAIIHVALALDDARFIHALGAPAQGVCIQSLEPTASDFNASLATLYLGARRVVA